MTDERELLLEQALNSNTLALAHIGTALNNINTALLAISANLSGHTCWTSVRRQHASHTARFAQSAGTFSGADVTFNVIRKYAAPASGPWPDCLAGNRRSCFGERHLQARDLACRMWPHVAVIYW